MLLPSPLPRSGIVEIVLSTPSGRALSGTAIIFRTIQSAVEYEAPPAPHGSAHLLIEVPDDPVTAVLVSAAAGEPRQHIDVELRPLSFAQIAARAVAVDPREAVRACYWRLAGLRVRAHNRLRRLLTISEGRDVAMWLEHHSRPWHREVQGIVAARAGRTDLPRIAVLAPSPDRNTVLSDVRLPFDSEDLRASGPDLPDYSSSSIATFARPSACSAGQTKDYSQYELAPRDLLAQLETIDATHVVLLRPGDRLLSGALWRIADAASVKPEADLFYGDQLLWDPGVGLRNARLTPEWNEPYFIAVGYTGPIAVRKLALVEVLHQLADAPLPLHLLVDGITTAVAAKSPAGRIARIPRPLSSENQSDHHARSTPEARARRAAVLGSLLASKGLEVRLDDFGWPRPVYPRPQERPLVSVIVPTRDRVKLLEPCIEGLRRRTRYHPVEIIIVDNDSRERQTRTYFEAIACDSRVRILSAPGPFNFSAINNMAARSARGRVLAFLNNDIEVAEPDWLCEMVAPALLSDIGAVGCRLDYPTGPVQHAGVIVGLNGLAGHAHRFFDPTHPGYMRRLQSAQYMSAVTAACMVVERAKFLDVGGFDEQAFPIALNDVDLCLKLQSRGLSNLYIPYARLIHKESASRAHDTSANRRAGYDQECEHFQDRWAGIIDADPCYHPLLTRTREDFSLSQPPPHAQPSRSY